MELIIQKICAKYNDILEKGLKKVLSGEDVSVLTSAIKEFTDELGKDLLAEIVQGVDELIYEDEKRKGKFESVRIDEKKLLTKNGKSSFGRRYYKDNETGEYIHLADKILGIEKRERIDKKVKAELIGLSNDEAYNKAGKKVVDGIEISATTVMNTVRRNEWKNEIQEKEEKIKAKQIYIQVDEDHIKQRNKK